VIGEPPRRLARGALAAAHEARASRARDDFVTEERERHAPVIELVSIIRAGCERRSAGISRRTAGSR
jgi:hypothetical protein